MDGTFSPLVGVGTIVLVFNIPASYRQRQTPPNVPLVTMLASGVLTHLSAQSVTVLTLLSLQEGGL